MLEDVERPNYVILIAILKITSRVRPLLYSFKNQPKNLAHFRLLTARFVIHKQIYKLIVEYFNMEQGAEKNNNSETML